MLFLQSKGFDDLSGRWPWVDDPWVNNALVELADAVPLASAIQPSWYLERCSH